MFSDPKILNSTLHHKNQNDKKKWDLWAFKSLQNKMHLLYQQIQKKTHSVCEVPNLCKNQNLYFCCSKKNPKKENFSDRRKEYSKLLIYALLAAAY